MRFVSKDWLSSDGQIIKSPESDQQISDHEMIRSTL